LCLNALYRRPSRRREMRKSLWVLSFILQIALATDVVAQTSSPLRRGLDWMDLKEYAKARHEFELAIQQEPKNIEARYQIALSYRREGNFESAIGWCRRILNIAPDHAKTKALAKEMSDLVVAALETSTSGRTLTALKIVPAFFDTGFLSPSAVLRSHVLALLHSSDHDVTRAALALLNARGFRSDALNVLARDSAHGKREMAMHEISSDPASNPEYVPVLKILASDQVSFIRERAVSILALRYQDADGKTKLAQILHQRLDREIEIGRTERGPGVQFHEAIQEAARIGPTLGDPSLAGKLAELLANGRVYGFLADDLQRSFVAFGPSARPHLEAVLQREPELRSLLRAKGFTDKSQVDWRFDRIRQALEAAR
jgi:tetratricopeptide (TPR) repeat protein